MTPDRSSFRAACAAIARRHDPERYLACLFAPPVRRDALFALLAANHEIAKTAEVVSEPAIGQIRLQWWRETLDGIAAGQPRIHEVAVPLAEAATQHGLRLERLHRLIDAREADLEAEPAGTVDALDTYAAATAGELHAAMAEVLGADPAAAQEAGTAWGLIGLMRAVPVLVAANRAPIPRSLLEETGVTHQKIKDSGRSIRLSDAVRPVVDQARSRLEKAREFPGFRAPAFWPLRLMADRSADHATVLRDCNYEPFDPRVAARPTGLIWRHAARMLRYRVGL